MEQRLADQIVRSPKTRGPIRRTHGTNCLVKEADGVNIRWPAFTTDDQAIDDLLLKVLNGSARLQAHPDVWMGRLEPLQARNEPVGQEACWRPQHNLGNLRLFHEFFATGLQLRKDLISSLLETLSFNRQTNAARVADEERFAEPFFQLPNLVAHGTVSNMKLACCRRDIQVSGGGVEGAECIEGWQSTHLARVSI